MTTENTAQIELITPDFDGAAKILRGYRGRYAGRRCFIIGNGPSLKAADLTRIKENGDFSIASNRIYLIFDQTDWRPDVYTVSDKAFFETDLLGISKVDAGLKIIPVIPTNQTYHVDGGLPVKLRMEADWVINQILPPFSDNITHCVCHGMTVTYVNIQIAVYLGFKELVLIGVDHAYSKQAYFPSAYRNLGEYDWERDPLKFKKNNQQEFSYEIRHIEGIKDHFCDNYVVDGMFGNGKECGTYAVEEAVRAYLAARQYAEQHGIRIVNATRGGKLNVFKRVSFDSLFPKPSG